MQNSARTIGPLETRFNAIMNSRLDLSAGSIGSPIRCRVSGTPKLGWYDERMDALKDIYSFNVNKLTVIDSKWFTEGHAKAIALEAQGLEKEAADLFNDLMNASQLSYGIINRDGTKKQFASGQTVDVLIESAQVEDKVNGVGVGTFHTALVVASISPVEAVILGKSKRFGAPVVEETAPVAAATTVAAPEQLLGETAPF
jgi:hypothetical protein